jgi:DNA-directed RNA polymerase subunit M/transcription elongation factor TFIIS
MGKFGFSNEGNGPESKPWREEKWEQDYENKYKGPSTPSEICEEFGHDMEGVRLAGSEDEPGSGFYRCTRCNYVMD